MSCECSADVARESNLDFGHPHAYKKSEQSGDGERDSDSRGTVREQAMDALRVS